MILGFIAESRVSELRCDEMKITHSDVATAIAPLLMKIVAPIA